MALKSKRLVNKKLGRLPTKRNINLAEVGITRVNPVLALIGTILIVLASGVLSKFAVVDRLIEASRQEAEAVEMQQQVDDAYEVIKSYGDLSEDYAHYTYAGMTEEELGRADRTKVFELLQNIVFPVADVDSWNLVNNQLSFTVTEATLDQVNKMTANLKKDPMVDYCTMLTAATDENERRGGIRVESVVSDDTAYVGGNVPVTAQITVYLNGVEAEEEKADTGSKAAEIVNALDSRREYLENEAFEP